MECAGDKCRWRGTDTSPWCCAEESFQCVPGEFGSTNPLDYDPGDDYPTPLCCAGLVCMDGFCVAE